MWPHARQSPHSPDRAACGGRYVRRLLVGAGHLRTVVQRYGIFKSRHKPQQALLVRDDRKTTTGFLESRFYFSKQSRQFVVITPASFTLFAAVEVLQPFGVGMTPFVQSWTEEPHPKETETTSQHDSTLVLGDASSLDAEPAKDTEIPRPHVHRAACSDPPPFVCPADDALLVPSISPHLLLR